MPRPISVSSGILIYHPFGHNRHGPKIGDVPLPFFGGGGSWVTIEDNVAWTEASVPCGILIHPSVRLATIHMGQKLGSAVPIISVGVGTHLTQRGLGRGLPL